MSDATPCLYFEWRLGCVLCLLLNRWPQCTLGYTVYSAHLAKKAFQLQPKAALGNMLKTAMHDKSSPCPSSSMGKNFGLENFKSKVFTWKIGLEGSIIIKLITWMNDLNAMHEQAWCNISGLECVQNSPENNYSKWHYYLSAFINLW